MSLIRHDGNENASLLESFGHNIFELPFRPLEMWRHLVDDDSIRVEEFMDGNNLVVRAELPGVDVEHDVDVSMVDGALCIRAERRQEEQLEERHMRRSELRYGSFSRIVALPHGAMESAIKASYKDGVLEVRIPVEESGMTSKIPIERG